MLPRTLSAICGGLGLLMVAGCSDSDPAPSPSARVEAKQQTADAPELEPAEPAEPVEPAQPAEPEPSAEGPSAEGPSAAANELTAAAQQVAELYVQEPKDCAAIAERLEGEGARAALASMKEASFETAVEVHGHPELGVMYEAAMEVIVSGRLRCP